MRGNKPICTLVSQNASRSHSSRLTGFSTGSVAGAGSAFGFGGVRRGGGPCGVLGVDGLRVADPPADPVEWRFFLPDADVPDRKRAARRSMVDSGCGCAGARVATPAMRLGSPRGGARAGNSSRGIGGRSRLATRVRVRAFFTGRVGFPAGRLPKLTVGSSPARNTGASERARVGQMAAACCGVAQPARALRRIRSEEWMRSAAAASSRRPCGRKGSV